MKTLENKKYQLNNKFRGRQSVQLFSKDPVTLKETDGTDVNELLRVVLKELSDSSNNNDNVLINDINKYLKAKENDKI